MKKFLILCSILSIVLTVSLQFTRDQGSFYCEEQHDSSTQCATCSAQPETLYDTPALLTNFVFIPTFLGEIFFKPISVTSINVVVTFDRPPAFLA
jgi:hypothetical protein